MEGAETAFKDYCLILQVHPDADAEIIDAAYWHLARRYGETREVDPEARAKMDDLNEAYSVMRSAERRDEFSRRRAAILGPGTLPVAPAPQLEPLPLQVMERQRERLTAAPEELAGVFSIRQAQTPFWQNLLAAAVILALAAAGMSGWVDRPLMLALLIFGLAFTAVPLLRVLPGVALPSMAMPSVSMPRTASQPPRLPQRDRPSVDATILLDSTSAIRSRYRDASATDAVEPAQPASAGKTRREPTHSGRNRAA